MSYVKQTWVDGPAGGTPIDAARLGHIEDGIEAASLVDDGVITDAKVAAAAAISADKLADGVTNKVYTATDQAKLAGIASGATANATDAQLRDRSTHTGTQAATTITGLAAVATSGAYLDLSGRPVLATVATSGAYADLSGTPDLSALTAATDQKNASTIVKRDATNGFGAAAIWGVGDVTGKTADYAANKGYVDSQISSVSGSSSAPGWANVKAYGALGNGTTDDTTAIQNAASSGLPLWFPPGTYKAAPNLDLSSPAIYGAGRHAVTISLTAGNYLIDSNQTWTELHVEGVTVDGGAGAIRNRYTGSNVTRNHAVLDCNFTNYTVCAISDNCSDGPLWHIERNLFLGANDSSCIGVALSGLTDTNLIRSNEFQRNYVHIKLGQGGNNAYVTNNDLVQYNAATAGRNRTMIWIVPQTSASNAGSGAVFSDNKYGNENLGVDDRRFVWADELTGTYFGDKLPNFGADSTGYVIGHTIRGGLVNGGTANPFIYSTTHNVRGNRVADLVFGGTSPSYIFQLRTPTNAIDPECNSNIAGPFRLGDQNFSQLSVTNQVALWRTDDGTQVLDADPLTPLAKPGGNRATGFVKLLQQRIASFTLSGATTAAVTDAYGGSDAQEITMGTGSVYCYVPASSMVAGMPIWIEFDVQQGSSNPLSELWVLMGYDAVGAGAQGNYFRRRIKPGSKWTTYRFLTQSGDVSNSILLKFQPVSGATGSLVRLGRVRMYHAREPIAPELVLPDATTTTTAPSAGGAGALPATPLGYVTVYINGAARKIAYY